MGSIVEGRRWRKRTAVVALVAVLLQAADVESVKALAAALGVPPAVVVLALLARIQASWDNAARCFFQAVLGPCDSQAVHACMQELGL